MAPSKTPKPRIRTNWTLLSNHGYVLVCIAGDPDIRLRDIASRVGITERAVFGIVEDLEAGGVIQRVKVGRRNRYLINVDQTLRHPIEAEQTVGALLDVFAWSERDMQELDSTSVTAG
jgi:DNA-binding Lrp family transcriptional regulator